MPDKTSKVTLREVTAQSVRQICALTVDSTQQDFVAPNAVSIAQAYFCDKAWFRAVYADDTPVGFAMLEEDTDKPEYFLWRFMIASECQRYGYGRAALALLIDHVKTRPMATEFFTSVVEGDGGPLAFYQKSGFVLTGEYEDDEAILRIAL